MNELTDEKIVNSWSISWFMQIFDKCFYFAIRGGGRSYHVRLSCVKQNYSYPHENMYAYIQEQLKFF